MPTASGTDNTVRVILLAGGRGTRLHPYTALLPKPLVPLGDVPVLEILLRRLKMHRLTEVTICTGHLAELITAFFGDGQRLGLRIAYSREDQPLGTAGPIGLVPDLSDPFVVMNGDLLTTLDFSAFLEAHGRGTADATIAVCSREVLIDFGVLEVAGDGTLADYQEKPVHRFEVSMGVYAFKRSVTRLIRPGERLDIPDLLTRLRADGGRVACFRSNCYWLDIGRVEDYARAQQDFEQDRSLLLPDDPLRGGRLES